MFLTGVNVQAIITDQIQCGWTRASSEENSIF